MHQHRPVVASTQHPLDFFPGYAPVLMQQAVCTKYVLTHGCLV